MEKEVALQEQPEHTLVVELSEDELSAVTGMGGFGGGCCGFGGGCCGGIGVGVNVGVGINVAVAVNVNVAVGVGLGIGTIGCCGTISAGCCY